MAGNRMGLVALLRAAYGISGLSTEALSRPGDPLWSPTAHGSIATMRRIMTEVGGTPETP